MEKRCIQEMNYTKGMIRALVGLCTCMDVDAIRPAVNIIDAFHRRIGRHDDDAARILEEAECLHALEHIYDTASGSASYGGGTDWSTAGHSGGMDYCAEMAANLIDDFCGDEEVDWDIGGSSKEFEVGVKEPVPVFASQTKMQLLVHLITVSKILCLDSPLVEVVAEGEAVFYHHGC